MKKRRQSLISVEAIQIAKEKYGGTSSGRKRKKENNDETKIQKKIRTDVSWKTEVSDSKCFGSYSWYHLKYGDIK